MPLFRYEAQNKKGERITGILEAENEDIVSKMLNEMEHIPISIIPTKGHLQKFYYVGKDKAGKTVEGSLETEAPATLPKKLNEMGLQSFRISTSPNLDVPYDDTALDKLSKGLAKFLIFILFGATAVFTMSLGPYLKAILLEEDKSVIALGTITMRKTESLKVKYAFIVDGKKYESFGYLKKDDSAQLKEGDGIRIRYSIRFPSVNFIDKRIPLNISALKKSVIISGLITLGLVILLILCSCFHYIGRILRAHRTNKPIPKNDVKRLIFNTISTFAIPLIFFNVFATISGQDEASLYHPYRFYFVLASIILAVIAITLKRKSPVFYD